MKKKNEKSDVINEDYFDYLTKRLDEGTGNNLFIYEVVKAIREELKHNPIVNLIDMGCFSGALLNNVLNNLSNTERDRIRAIGVDINKSVLERGSKKYKDILFLHNNLEMSLPLLSQYNILLLSNTLHEIINYKKNKPINDLVKVLRKMISLLKPGGKIIFMDGVKLDENKKLKVIFKNNNYEKFKKFSKIYFAQEITYFEEKKLINIDLNNLSTFFSKERYLETSYWNKESQEIYQFFSKLEIQTAFKRCNLGIIKQEIQFYKEEYINSKLSMIEPKDEKIPKNILIIAEKSL